MRNRIINDVITHEMLHVLGFGSLWDPAYKNLIQNAGTPQAAYTGALACTTRKFGVVPNSDTGA